MDAVVEVTGGRVRGTERGGVLVFSGIPYAGSPAGENRWRPPTAPAPWQGIKDADEFGPIAPQPPPTPGMTIKGDPTEQDEDCLFLNVWTPALDDARRPVMVWIHGGGFTTGTGASLLYRGGDLCRDGDVVVVTINYRLGALGFLGHSALSSEAGDFGNWGLMDQVAALRWVRDNIRQFGGDPEEVTIFGESAGGMSISALLGVPSARGLFRRAIIESGPVYCQTADVGARVATELAELVGVREVTREALTRVPAADLVQAGSTMQNRLPPPGEIPLPFLPVVDGSFLPVHPEEAVAAGSAARVPLLVGSNRDELTFFAIADRRLADMDHEAVDRWFDRAAPDLDTAAVLETYRARDARGDATSPRDLWIAAGSDFVFRWPTLRLAEAQLAHESNVFAYLFTWESPTFGGVLGSCHALEVPFVTGAVRHDAVATFSGRGPAVDALSLSMRQAWLAFARTGNPTVEPGNAGSTWPAWDPDRQATMIFGPDKGIGGTGAIRPLGGVKDAPLGLETDAWRKADARD